MAIQNLFKRGAQGYADYLAEGATATNSMALGRGFSKSILDEETTFQDQQPPTSLAEEQAQEEPIGPTWKDNVFFDVLGAPLRGAINTVDSIIDLVDTVDPRESWWEYDKTINTYRPSYL